MLARTRARPITNLAQGECMVMKSEDDFIEMLYRVHTRRGIFSPGSFLGPLKFRPSNVEVFFFSSLTMLPLLSDLLKVI